MVPARRVTRPVPAWAAYLGFTLAAVALYLVTGNDALREALYDLNSVAAAVVVGFMTWRRRPHGRRAWWLIAAALGASAVADCIWAGYVLSGWDTPPFPSWADPGYLVGAGLLAAGVWHLAATRRPSRGDLHDSLIVTLAVGLFTWLAVAGPAWSGDTDFARVIAVAYPISSAFVLAAGCRLLLGRMGRSGAAVLLAGGLASQLVADVAYARATISHTYVNGGSLDVLWMVACAAIAAATLHRTFPTVGRPVNAPAVTLTTPRFALLLSVLAVAPAALLVPGAPSYPVFLAVWLAVLALTALRLVVLVRGLGSRVLRDELTGLPNRVAFLEIVEGAVEELASRPGHVAVVFCDLDHFKVINDSYGHAVGDRVLGAVAERLASCVRPGDVVARLGGDEFAILVAHHGDRRAATALSDRVLLALGRPLDVAGFGDLYVTASVGVRVTDTPETRSGELLADADNAMYEAKENGRGRTAEFEPRLRENARRRLHLDNDLRHALAHGDLRLVYQPEVDLVTDRLVAVEALARWHHPDLGDIPPSTFIPAAEAAGIIERIFDWALAAALRQHVEWRGQGRTIPVAVNLSARQLTDPRLVPAVAKALADHGVDPSALWIEITESSLASGDAAATAIRALKALGISVAIDDFGTGYSSLSQLRLLPVDFVKVDRTFIARLSLTPADDEVVASIVHLTHSLGARMVAEGVETAEQLATLRTLGCDTAQGYFLARPMAPDAIPDLVAPDGAWLGSRKGTFTASAG
jgi:diguanylate cyclase (GGDEF)-like protein